jgi:hypothetical protein
VAFVLAHETAHHIYFHTRLGNNWSKEDELRADFAAATWLTRLGASVEDLRNSMNALGLSDDARGDYPTKCERLTRVIQGYNEVASETGRPAAQEPVCDPCAGKSTTKAWYPRRTLEAGVAFRTTNIISCGSGTPTEDLPLVYNRDIRGMCAVTRMTPDTQLTWNNIDVCALMRSRN